MENEQQLLPTPLNSSVQEEVVDAAAQEITPTTTSSRHYVLFISFLLLFSAIIVIIIAFSFYTTDKPSSSNMLDTTILFVFRDAGESYGLSPLLHQLNTTHHDEHVTALIIPRGTNPYWQSLLHNPFAFGPNFVLLSTLLNTSNTEGWFNREATLTPQQIHTLINLFPNVHTVVTGLVSTLQSQLATEFTERRVFGFDDGLSLGEWQQSASAPPFWSCVADLASGNLDELWVTSDHMRELARKSAAFQSGRKKNIKLQVITTGSPALSKTWQEEVARYPEKVKEWQERMVGGSSGESGRRMHWLHVYGGYDDINSTDYTDAINVLASGVATWSSGGGDGAGAVRGSSDLVVTFSPHPGKFPTSVEVNIFHTHAVDLIVVNAPSAILAAAANLTLSHYSTTGIQSLMVGTPHLFFSAPGIPPWDNIASDVIQTYDGEEERTKTKMKTKGGSESGSESGGGGGESGERRRSFRSYCDETGYMFNTSKLNDLGIPTNSVERMLERFVRA